MTTRRRKLDNRIKHELNKLRGFLNKIRRSVATLQVELKETYNIVRFTANRLALGTWISEVSRSGPQRT